MGKELTELFFETELTEISKEKMGIIRFRTRHRRVFDPDRLLWRTSNLKLSLQSSSPGRRT